MHDHGCKCRSCATNRLHAQARSRALRRLARMHPEEFYNLRCDELESLRAEREEWERRRER